MLNATRRKLRRQVDRRDHTVRTRDVPAGDLESRAVIGTGSRKRKAKRDVHAVVECVKLKRYQTLVMVHAEHAIEFTAGGAEKNRIRRERAVENRANLRRVAKGLHGWRDDLNFLAAQRARFTRMRIESSHGN